MAALPEEAVVLQPWAELLVRVRGGELPAGVRARRSPGAKLRAGGDQRHFESLVAAVYLLEKAVYEVGYELNNRPDWVAIPVRGIFQVVGTS